jgi:acylphosphatase
VAQPVGRKLRLFGRVQGVFFRQWAVGQARALRVSGWIRNCPDGSVEAHIIGDEAAVAEMVDRMHDGPHQAQVNDLMIEDIEPEDVEGFSVRL